MIKRAADEQAHTGGLEWGLEFRIKLAMGRHKTGHMQGDKDGDHDGLDAAERMLGFLQLIMERASE